MIGTFLNERYRLDVELGRGGMGVVYRAHDTLLHRDVAIKVLSPTALGTQGRARLLREAQAVAQLNHPNVVSVYDAGETQGRPFIVMELVKGESLHHRRSQTLEEICTIARQVCAALEHAHAQGIVHRDIKPENVLLLPDGTVKLVDFGLARSVASRLTTEGTLIGTVFYLAPEQALGGEVDHRADLYALGVVLYELTTGVLPFSADTSFAVITQHLHAPVVPPRARNPEIPPALDALIVRLLGKAPEERPASAAEVREVLERLVSGEEPSIAPLEVVEEPAVLDRIVRGRMVGRERELAEARARWKQAVAGEGQMLLISGEPGIGKTRLVLELATQVEVLGGKALVGACYAEGGAPYAPFTQILRSAFRSGGGDGLDLPKFVLADLLALAPALRLHYPDIPPNPPLDPQSEQQRLFENVVTFCAALSERAPLLLVLDDVHWADSGTLSLLRHLARRTRRQRLLIAAAYREIELDEARPFHEMLLDLHRERLAVRLKLSRLSRAGTGDMLATLFDEEISPEFLEGIYRETEGNPFFIEEVSKALVESGKLYYEGGRWHRPSVDELEIPQSVRLAIQSRVGKLPQDVQETLRLAAILGREFDFDTLAEASELGEDEVIDALEIAEQVQLIEEVSTEGSVTFAFVHMLIPTTLAEGVRTLRRRRLHRRAAAAIEALRADDFEALAHHYSEAGDDERALTYYTRAGERAAGAYANQEAENYFLAALDRARSEEDKAYLLSELGVVLGRQGRYEEAIETWGEGIALYRSLGEQEGVARLYARSARASWDAGDTPRGLELCREGMAAVAGSPDSPELANLLHETARACHFNCLLDEARSLCRQSLEMAEQLGAVEVQAEALTTLGTLPGQSAEEALSSLGQAVGLAESAGLLAQAARAHNNLAVVLGFHGGDFQAAREHLHRAAELARQRGAIAQELFYASSAAVSALYQGDIVTAEKEVPALRKLLEALPDSGQAESIFQMVEAFLLRSRGELEEAIERLQTSRAERRAAGDRQMLSGLSNTLAEILVEVSAIEESEAVLQEAIAVGDQGTVHGGVWPRCMLSVQYSRQRRVEAARRLLSEARAKAVDQGFRGFDTVMLAWAAAHLAAVEKSWSEAWASFQSAVDSFARMKMYWHRARTLREWAEAHLSRGEPEDRARARELLGEAAEELESRGILFYAAQVRNRLKELEGHG